MDRGAAPSPVIQELPVCHDSRGGVLVDATLQLPSYRNVWALGDCASVAELRITKPGLASTTRVFGLRVTPRSCILRIA